MNALLARLYTRLSSASSVEEQAECLYAIIAHHIDHGTGGVPEVKQLRETYPEAWEEFRRQISARCAELAASAKNFGR